MKKLSMVAGGRELTLRYTVQVMCEAEETYGSIGKLMDRMGGNDRPMQATLDMISYMANAGEKHAGRAADITPEWLRANLSPKQLQEARVLCIHALTVGMHRECAEDDDKEVDAVLAEIQKKSAAKQAEEKQQPDA